MTDEVARLVLQTNIDQNRLLRNDSQKVAEWLPSFERHIRWLEAHGDLDRALEFLPDDAELERRQQEGDSLTTPELAVLSAYAKTTLSDTLLGTELPDDPWFDRTLEAYFPVQLRERFPEQVQRHPLRREIIATVVANDVVNTGGTTFVFRAMEETGADAATVVHAYVAIKEIYAFGPFLDAVSALPASVSGEAKARTYLDARRVLDRAVRWFINHRTSAQATIGEGIEYFRDDVLALAETLPEVLRGQDAERYDQWRDEALAQGLPEDLASRRAYQFESFGLLDIVHLARRTGRDPRAVAEVYYRLYDRFDVDPVLNRITGLPRDGRWRALARAALRDDLYGLLVSFCADILDGEGENIDELVEQWVEDRSRSLSRAEDFLEDIQESGTDDLASLAVALRQLRAVTTH